MKDDKLTTSLENLRQSIDRSNSIKWTLLLGIVRGVGAVIGATLLAGLVLGALAATFDTASNIPVVGDFFSDISATLETEE